MSDSTELTVGNEAEAQSIMRMVAEGESNEQQHESAQPEADTAQAVGIASIMVQLLARGAVIAYPCLSFDDAVKGEAVNVLVPVLTKYNVSSEFLDRWKEEFAAGMFFAGVIFGSYQTVQADKRKREEKEVHGEPA